MFDQIPPPLVVEPRCKSMHHSDRTIRRLQQKLSGIEVIAPPSTPRPPRDLQRVQTQTDLCYTLSLSGRSAKQ
jgi:hypothetical protein